MIERYCATDTKTNAEINQYKKHAPFWPTAYGVAIAERDEARKVARRLYADNQLKDGDITRMCEELDKVNALRPIGAPPIIAYYTPHGQPVSVTNNPVGYTLKR